MQLLMYILFVSIFSLDYLHYCLKLTPFFTTLVPDLICFLLALVVFVRAAVNKKFWMSLGYMVVFASYCTFMACGSIANELNYGPIILGIRSYLKFLPIFFLPSVLEFSAENVRKQLKFLMILLVIQFPVAVCQRFILHRSAMTGDYVTGTLWVSGDLSIVLLCAIAIVIAFMLNKQIKSGFAAILLVCLFIPTTLNETKISLIILPFIITVPAVIYRESIGDYYRHGKSKVKVLAAACLLAIVLIPSFITVYDMMLPRSGSGIVDIFKRELAGKGYYFTGAKSYHEQAFGRGDAIRLAFDKLSHDPLSLAFGLGMGNVMQTSIKELRGKHTVSRNTEFDYRGQSVALTYMLWELGLSGFMMYMIMHLLILRDALYLRNFSGIFGSISLGWVSIVLVMMVCFLYTNIIRSNPISMLFWYFSGIIAANACRMRAVHGLSHERHEIAKRATPAIC